MSRVHHSVIEPISAFDASQLTTSLVAAIGDKTSARLNQHMGVFQNADSKPEEKQEAFVKSLQEIAELQINGACQRALLTLAEGLPSMLASSTSRSATGFESLDLINGKEVEIERLKQKVRELES